MNPTRNIGQGQLPNTYFHYIIKGRLEDSRTHGGGREKRRTSLGVLSLGSSLDPGTH